MPLDYNEVPDFDLDTFNFVVLESQGTVTLEPNNRIPSQFLREIGTDGSPPGWQAVSGPTSDGYHAYLFKTDGDVRTGGRQTINPDSNEQGAHLFTQALKSGGLPPTSGSPGVIIPAQPLEAPALSKVAGTVIGFPQGEYLTAISLVDAGGQHTRTTTPVQISITTDAKLIEFKLILDADRENVTGQGLWLSEPVALGQTPDPATLRLQDVAPNSGRTYTLRGPYNYSGRSAPTKNETEIGTPPTLSDSDFTWTATTGKYTQPGKYVFYIVQSTALGDSLPSAPTGYHTTQKPIQWGLVFHPSLHPSALGYKIFWQDFFESSNPPFYQLVRTRAGDKARYFTPDEKPVFYGNVDSGELAESDPGPQEGAARNFTASSLTDIIAVTGGRFNNGQEVRVSGGNLPAPLERHRSYWVRDASGSSLKLSKSKGGNAINLTSSGSGTIFTYTYVSPPQTFSAISIQGDPPTEDTSGIADPTGEADAPLVVGLGIPGAGTYKVGYTRLLNGRETPISALSDITLTSGDITAGMVIKMSYPPRVTKFPNALYGQINQKGLPFSWLVVNSSNATVSAADTNHNFDAAGEFFVRTSGSLANTGRYPYVKTNTGEQVETDPGRLETVAGWLVVSDRTAGSAYAELVQYNSSGAEVGTRLTLATMSANGALYFEKTIAATGLGADLTLNSATTALAIQWGTEGNPRNLKVKVHSLIWAPQEGVSRRYEPRSNPQDPWIATTDPAAPYPNSHVLAIGQPPPTAASTAGAGTTAPPTQSDLISLMTFEGGAAATGWVRNYTATSDSEATIGTTGKIEGTYGLRIRNDADASLVHGTYEYQLNDATHGNNYALRWLVKFTREPSHNYYVSLGGIGLYAEGGTPHAGILYYGVTNEIFVYYGDNGAWAGFYNLPFTVSQGDVLDIEIRVTNSRSSSGKVEFYVGVNGAARTLRETVSGLNWTLSSYANPKAYIGVSNYSTSFGDFTLDYDSVALTKTGYTGQQVIENTAPALTPLVQPDWPWLDGTTLNGPNSSPVDYTYTTGNNAALGLAATFNRSGAVAAERTLMQIRTSGGTELVGVYMKTDHTVEMRKGATIYQASAAVPTGTNYRFDLIVTGAGTANGSAVLYRTVGTGKRELIVLATSLDFSTTQAQRATVANNTELTETSIVVTASGEYVYDNVGPDGAAINQGYVSILAADVTDTDVGFDVAEQIVVPGIERTFAVFMRADDLPVAAAPFTIVCYDSLGNSVELGSVYANGTAVANASPGWAEYWMTYTPPEGYYRRRIEHRNMTAGRYVFQKPLDTPGNISTASARAALRDDRYALEGSYNVVLNARIPAQSGTMVANSYGEERTALDAEVFAPSDDGYTFTADASTNVITTSGTHRWQTGSTVTVESSDTLPAPLALETTYYVRDATATTLKLSATAGGAAIDLTSAGTGTHTIAGTTAVSVRWRASDDAETLDVQAWHTDTEDVPDYEWIEAEVTLTGDGILTPQMPVGSPRVEYVARNMPVLLRGDRTPLPGGVYIGGGGYGNNLFAPFSRSLYDTESVGDRATPRSITDPVRRLWGFTLNVFDPRALAEIYANGFLDDDWAIESPFHDLVMRVHFYEPPDEPEAMIDYEGFDERIPFAVSRFMPLVVQIERAEVVEQAVLSGEAPGTSD